MEPSVANYYSTLGLDRRCTSAQIRAAYRSLAKRFHPDLNSTSADAVTRSQELNAAHETLSDPVRRRAYDRELDAAEGRPDSSRAARIERNVSQEVRLRIEEFLKGTSLEVRINDPGNLDGPEIYSLVIPPGTPPGARFRIPRAGHFSGGCVQVRVRALPSALFKLRGSDLCCVLRISATRASAGGSEMIRGANGTMHRVQIPPKVARGEILRIPGEGLPKPRGGRGDLLVHIVYRPEVRVSRSGLR